MAHLSSWSSNRPVGDWSNNNEALEIAVAFQEDILSSAPEEMDCWTLVVFKSHIFDL